MRTSGRYDNSPSHAATNRRFPPPNGTIFPVCLWRSAPSAHAAAAAATTRSK